MIFYIFLSLLFLFGIIELFDIRNDKYVLYVLSFLLFCIFSGLKYNVGTDYLNYADYYNRANDFGLMTDSGVEPGYIYLMQFFKLFTVGFIGFWFIISAFNFALKYYVFSKYSPLLFASLLVYFVGLFMERDFDGIRQGLSIGLCYFSISAVLNRQPARFILIVLCASLIHISAIIFLPVYFIAKARISNKTIYTVIGILVVLVIVNVSFTSIIISTIPESLIKARIETYLSQDDSQYVQKVGISIGIIFRIVVLFLFVYLEKYILLDEKLYTFLKNGFFVGIVLSLVFNDVDVLSHRLSYIYREFQIFIVPILITLIPSKKGQLVALTFLFLYSVSLLNRMLNADT
ncbi:MAG: EpsG family protein, partial [Mucilaginibacter sp.]